MKKCEGKVQDRIKRSEDFNMEGRGVHEIFYWKGNRKNIRFKAG